MTAQTFLLYLATWSLVALSPGPAVMCSVAQSTRYGFQASLAGVLGIQLGNLLFFTCVALGLGALLAKAVTAFAILRVLGVLYLFYLGARILIHSFGRSSLAPAEPAKTEMRAYHGLFVEGLLVQVTNPKALLFVTALLPQFINPHHPVLPQLAILVLTTVAVDFAVLSSYAFVARHGLRSFRTSRYSTWLERFCGTALIFFGARLLLARK